MKKRCGWLLAAIWTLCMPVAFAADVRPAPREHGGNAAVRIGVLAKRGSEKCLQEWEPTAEYLSGQIPGHTFRIVPLAFEEIYPAVQQEQIEFILVNSSFYVGLERFYRANRIVTLQNVRLDKAYTVFGGVIFCRADHEDIQCSGDLVGKNFCAVTETSFGGWQTAWRELKQQGINPQRDFASLRFAGTHDAVVEAVRNGEVDAGTVRTDTLERMAQEGKINLDDFRVIDPRTDNGDFDFRCSTRLYPEWPLAKLFRTSDELAEQVAAALMGMAADCPAAKAAHCAGWTIPQNYQPVHECLRELRIGPYKDYRKVTVREVFRQYWHWLLTALIALVATTLLTVYVLRLNRRLTLAVSTQQRRARQQAEVARFGQLALSGIGLDDLFDQAVRVVSRILETKYAKVLEHRADEGVLFLRAGVGWKDGWVRHASVLDGAGSQGGYTLVQSKPVIAEDVQNESRFSPPPLLTEHNVVGGMTVAIPGPERPFGVLGVHTDRMQHFNQDDAHFLEAIANVLAAAIERRRSEERLQQTVAALESANEAMKESHQLVESATRAKSEFLANMSHEIRTPMTAILGFADVLLGDPDIDQAPPERLEAIRTIQRNGQYLLKLINDILDLSKIEAERLHVERIACSPAQVLADVVSLMRVRADAKNLPLNVEYVGGIPELVRSDPLRLRQVLINLVGNAIKFTEIGSIRLVVRLTRSLGKSALLQVDVCDTGIGLTHQEISRLFRPFSQADSSTTRNFGGTGLGLTISKRLAEMLGGDITISSTPGKGSTFSVTIETGDLEGVRLLDSPLEGALPATSASLETSAAAVRIDRRVLLAEDGPDNQRLIAFILKKAGAQVTVAENGQIACDQAWAAHVRGEPFDVILMDMQMPVMDGYEATRQLRADGYVGPIIALTAHAMKGDDTKCHEAGCDGYLTKPIDRVQFLPAIARVIAEVSSSQYSRGNAQCRP